MKLFIISGLCSLTCVMSVGIEVVDDVEGNNDLGVVGRIGNDICDDNDVEIGIESVDNGDSDGDGDGDVVVVDDEDDVVDGDSEGRTED